MYSLSHARVNLLARVFMSAWTAAIHNSFSLHVFDSDAVDMPLRPIADRFGGCFCWALAPFLFWFWCCFAVCFVFAGETQVWLGDLRVVAFCVVVVFVVLIQSIC